MFPSMFLVPVCLSRSASNQHMAPARAHCCLSATSPGGDWFKLGRSVPHSAPDWLKLGRSLRPQSAPCHGRVTGWLWVVFVIVRINVWRIREKIYSAGKQRLKREANLKHAWIKSKIKSWSTFSGRKETILVQNKNKNRMHLPVSNEWKHVKCKPMVTKCSWWSMVIYTCKHIQWQVTKAKYTDYTWTEN